MLLSVPRAYLRLFSEHNPLVRRDGLTLFRLGMRGAYSMPGRAQGMGDSDGGKAVSPCPWQ